MEDKQYLTNYYDYVVGSMNKVVDYKEHIIDINDVRIEDNSIQSYFQSSLNNVSEELNDLIIKLQNIALLMDAQLGYQENGVMSDDLRELKEQIRINKLNNILKNNENE